MNVILDISNLDITNIFFQNPIKNNIIEDSNFIRILYSNDIFILNGIFLSINLNIKYIDKYYNKYKYVFSYIDNKNIIDTISTIENILLYMINIPDKTPIYSIREQLTNETIKLFSDIKPNNNKKENEFILKIYGIWETDNEYGITYKIIDKN